MGSMSGLWREFLPTEEGRGAVEKGQASCHQARTGRQVHLQSQKQETDSGEKPLLPQDGAGDAQVDVGREGPC